MSGSIKTDDLQHDWPPDVLHYETRYFAGLTIPEMSVIVLPAIGVMALTNSFVLGILAIVLGFLLMKRFDALAGRSVLFVLGLRLRLRLRPNEVVLPLILPAGKSEVILETWEGQALMREGGNG